MYAQSIVEQRLELAKEELGFTPEYHSVSEVDDFDNRLKSRYEKEYLQAQSDASGSQDPTQSFQISMTRALCDAANPRLRVDEVRWMRNERTLAQCDAAYFLTRYYWIKTPRSIQRFTFLPGQRVYFNVVAEMEARGAAVEMIAAKARQHGVSTETEGLVVQRANFGYGTNCVVASADRQKTEKMAQMTFLGYDMLPWWMRALSTRRVESNQGMLVFGQSRSGISFQHGSQTSGIARGDTVKIYHLSEVASYTSPEQQIEASLFRCVHPFPDVFGVLESSSEGDEGWWYDTYWHAKKEFKNGKSRLCAMFLPWFLGTDKYPTPTWIRTHPVPDGWRPIAETRSMTAKGELYVRGDPMLSKVLGSNYRIPREQQWYWEANYLEHRSKGLEKTWFQEMPTDDIESFQGSYDNVFGKECIAEVWTNREKSYAVYGIVGQSIEDRHEPDAEDVDYRFPRVPVKYHNRKSNITYRWEMVPLKWDEPFAALTDIRDDDSHMGKLFVWLEPEIGYDYAIGVDTSNGMGEDGTVINVCRRSRSSQEQDIQAAEFRDNRVGHVEAFAWVMAIAAYYSRFMGDSPEVEKSQRLNFREPYVAVEQIAAVGDTVNINMRGMGYSRFHRMGRYDSVPKMMKKSKFTKEGWFTSGWSRPILTSTFVTLVQNGWYKVNSPYTLWEMDHWEVHLTGAGKEKYEHDTNATDDGIFANALSAFCPNDRKPLAERTAKQFSSKEGVGQARLSMTPTNSGIMVPTSMYSVGRSLKWQR